MASTIKPFQYRLQVKREIPVPNGEPLYEVELHLMARDKQRPEKQSRRCFTQSELMKLKRILAETQDALRMQA